MEESDAALLEFREKVSEAIRAQFVNGTPKLWRTAKKVGTSVRTLQRRLDALGVTHRVLVGEVRVEEAGRLLRRTDLNVIVIAAELGYADATAFSRAFRRQVGQTPREFRQARSRAPRV